MHQILLLLSFLSLTLATGFLAPPSRRIVKQAPATDPPLAGRMTLILSTSNKHESLRSRGGAMKASSTADDGGKFAAFVKVASSVYGTGGVMYILLKAIRRVVPIALEPFAESATPMTQFQLGAYVVTCLWFAYVEGYKGFQTKFSPLVVSRSFTLEPGTSKIHHFLLAPLYSMGLFHATKKRMIVSWCVTLGVGAIVHAVKKLPYPWRNIVDAGVVSGLTWGCISILLHYVKSLTTGKSPADPALPKSK